MRAPINGFTAWSNMRLAAVPSSGSVASRGEEVKRLVVHDILKELMEGPTMKLLLQSET